MSELSKLLVEAIKRSKSSNSESPERRLLRMVCQDDDAIGTILGATRAASKEKE